MELTNKKIGIGICVVIFLIGAFLMSNYNGKINEAETRLAGINKKIADAQEVIDTAAIAEEGDIGVTLGAKVDLNNPDEVAKFNEDLAFADEAGALIARMQNEYQGIPIENHAGHAEELDKVLAPDSVSARTPWYVDSEVPSEWTSSKAYVANEGQIPMMWLCRNPETGELLAYATGRYDTNDGLFHGMSHMITVVGQSHIRADHPEGVDGHNDDVSIDDIQDMMDAIMEAGEGIDPTEDLTEISSGRDALKNAGIDADEY